MAQTVLYLLNNTDNSASIVLQPTTFDGQGGVQRHTDLTLYGNGAPSWGARFDDNFLRLLENFAVAEKSSITLPIPKDEGDIGDGFGINVPVAGQQWFNKTRTSLYVYTGTNGWKPSTSIGIFDTLANITAVSTPRVGEFAYSTDFAGVYTYNGTAWVPAAVALGGNVTNPMTGPLILVGDPTVPLQAATKSYVDSATGGIGGKVNRSGDTMTGFLTLVADPVLPLQAATKQYVDASASSGIAGKVNRSGDTMTGSLTLVGDPASALQAATKQYVDTRVIRSGDTMTGFLTLSANPTAALHAATKAYVDALITNPIFVLGQNGKYVFPGTGGLKFIWGITASLPRDTVSTVTFWTAFTSTPYFVLTQNIDSFVLAGGANTSGWATPSWTSTGFTYANDNGATRIIYLALGI